MDPCVVDVDAVSVAVPPCSSRTLTVLDGDVEPFVLWMAAMLGSEELQV
jgi:hypothetical protein